MNLFKKFLIIAIVAAFAVMTMGVVSKVKVKAAVVWSRITSVSDLLTAASEESTVIIGYEGTANSGVIIPMANSGSLTTSAAGFVYSGSEANSGGTGTIDMSDAPEDTSDYELTIVESTEVDGAICIKLGSNYLGNTNTKNNCKLFTAQSETTAFTPTYESNKFVLTIDANATYHDLQYNTGSPRFAVYNGGQKNLVIFKKTLAASTEVSIGSNFSLQVGQTKQLSATFDGVEEDVIWDSSNPSVATVSNSGLVTAVAAGESVISVLSENGLESSCTVTVTAPIAVTGVSVAPTSGELYVGETLQLAATVSPDNAADKSVTWVSSNGSFATVSDSGLVTAVAAGSATITATTTDGGYTSSCTITVVAVPVSGSTISIPVAKRIVDLGSYGSNTYTIEGRISSIVTAYNLSNNNITVDIRDDASNVFQCYKMTGGSELLVGNKISVTGNIKKYDSTYEFDKESEYEILEYVVAFNSKGGSAVPTQYVAAGNKASVPTPEPTNADYELEGWYKENECLNKWNFDSDTVNSNIILYANWSLPDIDAMQTVLNNMKAYFKCGYKFKYLETEHLEDYLDKAFTGNPGSYKDWSNKSGSDSTAIYAGNSNGGNSSIQLRNTSPSGIVTTKSGGFARKITVDWNTNTADGRTLQIYGKNSAYASSADLYSSGDKGTLLGSIVNGTSTELEITSNYLYIGLVSSNGAMYLNSISIEWDYASFDSLNTDFRIKLGVDDSLADSLSELTLEHQSTSKCGIEVTINGTTKHVLIDNVAVYDDSVNHIKYIVIDLENIFDNVNIDPFVDIIVRPYVLYLDGEAEEHYYYSNHVNGSKTYSFVDLIKAYHDLSIDEVEPLYDLMVELGYIA